MEYRHQWTVADLVFWMLGNFLSSKKTLAIEFLKPYKFGRICRFKFDMQPFTTLSSVRLFMRSFLFVALQLLTFIVSAAEDTPHIQCNYSGNQQEMNACAVRDFKTADRSLNDKYKKIMLSLTPEKQQLLRRQQRAWLKQRDPKCKKEARLSEGGSIWPLEFFGCLDSITKQRTKALGQ